MKMAIARNKFAAVITVLLSLSLVVGPLAHAEPAKVNMNLKGADIAEVFRGLAEVGGLNIVLDPAVKGTLTIKLQDLTVDEALKLVAYAAGVEYRVIGSSLIVTSKGAVTALEQPVTEKIPLAYAKTAEVAPALALVAPNTKLQADARTNSFVAHGPRSEISALREVVAMLDVPIAPPEAQKPSDVPANPPVAVPAPVPVPVVVPVQEALHIIRLEHAPALSVANVVRVMVESGKVEADDRTNSLVILADDATWARVGEIVAALDLPKPEAISAPPSPSAKEEVTIAPTPEVKADAVKVIRLGNASAAQIRAALGALVDQVRLSSDERTNSLVVLGRPDKVAMVEEVVALLDVALSAAKIEEPVAQQAAAPAKPIDEMRVVRLENASAMKIGENLTYLVPELRVSADERTNSLVLLGSAEYIEKAKGLIAMLDIVVASPSTEVEPTPAAPAPVPVEVESAEVVKLEHASPARVRDALAPIMPVSKISIDERTGAVVIMGTAAERSAAKAIIAQLDVAIESVQEDIAAPQPPADPETLQVIKLAHAPAARVRDALAPIIPLDSITVDERTNSLVISTLSSRASRAMAVIEKIDVPLEPVQAQAPVLQAEKPTVVTYRIVNANAEDLKPAAALLASAANIQVDQRTNTLVVLATPSVQAGVAELVAGLDMPLPPPPTPEPAPEPEPESMKVFRLAHAAASDMKSLLSSLVPNAKMQADDRTRSLVVVAVKSVLATVEDLVKSLDVESIVTAKEPESAPDPVVTRVYRLNYAAPQEIASALSSFVSGKVSADPRTSSVAVMAAQSEHQRALELIEALDRAMPQVLIEARLEELSGDAGRKLGLDWSFGGIKIGENALGQWVDVSLDVLANLTVLEEQGKATLISRQHTFTVDGKTGKILIGDRIPVLIQEVQDGQVVNRVDFINAGIELSITPKVSDDGTITAVVKPVISSVVGWTPQNYPQIRTRELETIVSVKSGQTAVIGGLLHRDEIENLSKVPLLGDIPLLGELFRKRTTTTESKEIVMLITAWQVNPDQCTAVGTSQPGDAYPITVQGGESK